MVIADFQIEHKGGRPRFFQETFLVADNKFEMVLGMFFFKISNADIAFSEGTLTWKFYITNEALLTTEQVQLVDPKEFVIAALDADSKTFIVYVAIWEQEKMAIDPDKERLRSKLRVEPRAEPKPRTKLRSEPYFSTKLPLRSQRSILITATSFWQKTQRNSQKTPR